MSIAVLDTASIGRPITRLGVSLFPVYLHGRHVDIASGRDLEIVITEKDGGTVPELLADNPHPRPVLIVDGSTVVGGRQNRVVNVTVLVPPQQTLSIPVSCIEQGRWNEGTSFRQGRSLASRRVRRAKTDSVGRNVRDHGGRNSDQGEVWKTVHDELSRLDAMNSSMSFDVDAASIERDAAQREAVQELVERGPLPDQCGVVVAHGRRIVAADVFGHPEVLASNWEALVRSCLLDARDTVGTAPSATKALRFLHRLGSAPSVERDAVGLGREHHVRTRALVGQALVLDGLVVHASAFALAA